MLDSEQALRERILQIMPKLVINQLEINHEGLINDVAIVNQELVFRFAKTERYAQVLQEELKILALVRPRTRMQVPTPLYQSDDAVVYPYLKGQSFLRENFLKVDSSIQIKLAEQLGEFFYNLHTTPTSGLDWEVPATLAPVSREKWLELQLKITKKVYPLLLKHQVQWADNLFDSMLNDPSAFNFEPALIHGDVAPYHILFNPQLNQITGVLDFGVAGLGDPASDIGGLIVAYGERFVSQMQLTYPSLNLYLPRARFYAQAIELEWVLLGLESGEPFWFTAHIGSARDIA